MKTGFLIFTLFLAGCHSVTTSVHSGLVRINWEYVQSVGGMTIGNPYIDAATNTLRIPLIHDFSGAKRITVEPTLVGSNFECVWAEVNSWGGNLLATNIDISFWGAERSFPARVFPGDCQEAVIQLNSPFGVPIMSTINVGVRFREPGIASRLGLNRRRLGRFSL